MTSGLLAAVAERMTTRTTAGIAAVLLTAAALVALLLAGCDTGPVTGTVTGPEQEPPPEPTPPTVVAAIEEMIEIQTGDALSMFNDTDADAPLGERLHAVAERPGGAAGSRGGAPVR